MSLLETHPELVAYWHPTLNGEINPSDVTYGSRYKAWWLCELGHETESKPINFKEKFSCKVCIGKEILKGFNDLAATHPEVAKQWHPTKNLPLTPNQVSKGSHKRVVWVCSEGHEWVAMIYGVFGCPTCKYTKAKLSTLDGYPKTAKLWDYEKNAVLIEDVCVKDKDFYWWVCDDGHSFQSKISNQIARVHPCKECRSNSARKKSCNPVKDIDTLGDYETTEWECARCKGKWLANKKEMSTPQLQGFHICGKTRRRLFDECPELLSQWHPIKNFMITKESVNVGSNNKYWWVCSEGHEWETSASHRYKGAGCLHCSKSGYKPLEPAILYFLYNEDLDSFKVGITNLSRSRLVRFKKLGWECLHQVEHANGYAIKSIESEFFRWLRKEECIPQHLDKSHFGYVKGSTETFSAKLITRKNVTNKIAELETFYCK